MSIDESAIRRSEAAQEFNRHENRNDGAPIAGSLRGGFLVLRDSLYVRVHDDVQRRVGMDSMLAPISEEKTQRVAKLEIELYEIAVSAALVQDRGYLSTKDEWYVQWLARMRLGQVHDDGRVSKRLAYYLSKTPDDGRLAFSNVLASALPESRRAPLVLFRLVQPAVQIVTAIAFEDDDTATAARAAQIAALPAIRDCHECHGKLLDNGEQCRACGNPLWKFEWLTAAD
jgi:hypothetical protein